MAHVRKLCVGFSSATRVARLQLGNIEVAVVTASGEEQTFILPAGFVRAVDLQLDLWRRQSHEKKLLRMNEGDLDWTLLEAADEGGIRDVPFLLSHGADANRTHIEGYHFYDRVAVTALWCAAFNGDLGIVSVLLDAGADQIDKALYLAAVEGHGPVAALLLARGADVDYVPLYEGRSGLEQCASTGNIALVTMLLDAGASQRVAALIQATNRGHIPVVSLLLARGVHVDSVYETEDEFSGWTALQWAAYAGRLDVVTALLDAGARSLDGALCSASQQGHLPVFNLLLERGADVNYVDDEGNTALSLCAANDYLEVMQKLLDADASDLDSALWSAAAAGHLSAVQKLLDKGAETVNADRALCGAVSGGHMHIITVLLARAANASSAIPAAARAGRADVMTALLDAGAGGLEEALLDAAALGNERACALLLDGGADVHHNNDAALLAATENGHLGSVKLLLARGANVHAQSERALRMAKGKGSAGVKLLSLLRRYGAGGEGWRLSAVTFPSSLSASQRARLHAAAQARGLAHESRGKGAGRHIVVQSGLVGVPLVVEHAGGSVPNALLNSWALHKLGFSL